MKSRNVMMSHLHYKKNLVTTFTLIILFVAYTFPVIAASTKTISEALREYRNARTTSEQETELKKYAKELIEYRTETIDSALGIINAESRIAESDRKKIQQLLDFYKNSLTELNIQIEQRDELYNIKLDVEKIFWDYGIFTVIIPKAYGLKTTYKAKYIHGNHIKGYFKDIHDSISTLKKASIDTSQLEEKFEELKELSADLDYQITEAENNFNKMEPDRNRSISQDSLKTAISKVETIQQRLETIQFRMGEIIKILKKYEK